MQVCVYCGRMTFCGKRNQTEKGSIFIARLMHETLDLTCIFCESSQENRE